MSYKNKVLNQTLFVPEPVKIKQITVRQFQSCENCRGTGLIYVINWTQSKFISRDCRKCKGLGEKELK
jgi:DnaJ-class molecular chaperone